MGATPIFDVAIIGGGPAGAACAISCAQRGMRVLILEKATFPRDKVCGDCLNPGCWPLLTELGVAQTFLALPHQKLKQVEFIHPGGCKYVFPFAIMKEGEIAMTRRVLDEALLRHAGAVGAEVREGVTLQRINRDGGQNWELEAGGEAFAAQRLVAADGRNSTVARLLGAAPPARRDRIGLQTHIVAPACTGQSVQLRFLPEGYCGSAPVGGRLLNISLVANSNSKLDALKTRIADTFQISPDQEWRSIAPLAREPIGPLRDGVIYVGDAARVVEPFTGEGIYYALRSGMLAARHLQAGTLNEYPAAHAALYRNRLWINRLARWAVTHPTSGAFLLRALGHAPSFLAWLVRKVTNPISGTPRKSSS